MKVTIRDTGVERSFIHLRPCFLSRKINPVATAPGTDLIINPVATAPGTDLIINPVAIPTRRDTNFILALAHPDTCRLMWGQNYVAQSLVDQCIHHGIVTGSLWQPHTFGFAAKSIAKIR